MEVAAPVSLRVAVNARLVNWLPVGTEDPRSAVALENVGEGLDADPGIEGVGEPLGEHPAHGLVHDDLQLQEAVLDGNLGHLRGPDLVYGLKQSIDYITRRS